MSKEKRIATGVFSFLLFFLIRDGFLVECGLDIVGNPKANFFLACTVFGFVALGVKLIPEKYMGIGSLIPTICLLTLFAIGISACNTSCKENRETKSNTFREKVKKEKDRIEANLATKQAYRELGLSKKKSGQTKRSYSRRTTTSKKRVETPPPSGKWGQNIGTSTFPEVVNSWSRFAQTEAQEAMQRVANPGNKVKIE